MKERRKTSYLWGYFSEIDDSDKTAQCNICDKVLGFKTTVTNLRRHLERMHPSLNISLDSAPVASSAITSAVCDNVVEVNGQNEQQDKCFTHIIESRSRNPRTYSVKIQTVKDATNEPNASGSILGVGDNGTMHQMSNPPAALSSAGTKRAWQEPMDDELLVFPRKQHSSPPKENDEYDLFGMNIAVKMRKMSEINDVQRIIAEKLISEVLFHGQLQSLTFDTVIKIPEKD